MRLALVPVIAVVSFNPSPDPVDLLAEGFVRTMPRLPGHGELRSRRMPHSQHNSELGGIEKGVSTREVRDRDPEPNL